MAPVMKLDGSVASTHAEQHQRWRQHFEEVLNCPEPVLLLSCAKSHMLSASRRQPHLLHVSAADRHQNQ